MRGILAIMVILLVVASGCGMTTGKGAATGSQLGDKTRQAVEKIRQLADDVEKGKELDFHDPIPGSGELEEILTELNRMRKEAQQELIYKSEGGALTDEDFERLNKIIELQELIRGLRNQLQQLMSQRRVADERPELTPEQKAQELRDIADKLERYASGLDRL